MRVSFHPDYTVPLPEGHPFPMRKFAALHDILLAEGLITLADVMPPEEAAWADLRLVHTEDYLTQLATGTLSPKAERRLGVPWSHAMLHRSRLSVQGTLNAAKAALDDGIAANLAGGTHHAFPDHGEGYCVMNDVAISARALHRDGHVRRVLIIDLDVHQGNGTAETLSGDAWATTFSMHGERNYPWRKPPSTRDVDLPDGLGDDAYCDVLASHLPSLFDEARPDLVFYLAGVDPLAGDRFGRLALTRDGLGRRDAAVLEAAYRRGVPIVLTLSGGYAKTPEITADCHAIVHREARSVWAV